MQHPPVPALEPVLVDIPTACRALSISRGKLYQLLGAGEIRRVHIGSRALIPADDLRDFAARLSARSDTAA